MQSSVLDAFTPLSMKFEGYVPNMYLDVKGLVTTGMGNLIDSVGAAQALPWRHGSGGELATPSEIAAAWHGVKAAQDHSQIGGGNSYWKSLNDLRLDDDGIQQLIRGKVDTNTSILQNRFPAMNNWPAPAQLAIQLMAWAMGANFNYPHFQAAVNATLPDFNAAADQSYMPDNPEKSMDYAPTSNPGLRPRNIAVNLLFKQAAAVQADGGDYSVINLPSLGDLTTTAIQQVSGVAASAEGYGVRALKTSWGKIAAVIGGVATLVTAVGIGFEVKHMAAKARKKE